MYEVNVYSTKTGISIHAPREGGDKTFSIQS